ncbi:coiled-coil domain-containing protein [Nonomuraea sp. NPDC050536]|uniref:coiled-coil domain-containing protein n=1 Tax=Nonomuraea sp. NPDC050536 TaxID=3364366 RepID=UPI0037C5B613
MARANFAIGLIAATAVALSATTPASAAPKPTEKQLRAELKQLNSKIDTLIESYNAKRVELTKAKKAAETAKQRLATAQQGLDQAERKVAELATLRYQNGDPALSSLIPPPTGSGAAVLEQLTSDQVAMVQAVTTARDETKQASDDAAALAARIKANADDVGKEKDQAEGLIKDIQQRLQNLIPYGPGRKSDGSWAPELPGGSDNITPRMRTIRGLIEKNFKLPFDVGCFRSGGGGEHPLGRACDFMMSSGGTMPGAANNTLGDQIAAWALKNQDKLGVKYVIWKQRINMGSGWRAMEDRGSITENHYDHVHISMN